MASQAQYWVGPDGQTHVVAPQDVQALTGAEGYRPATLDEINSYDLAQGASGPIQGALAGVEAAGRTIAPVVFTKAEENLGAEPERIRAREQAHPWAGAAGTLGAIVGPGLLSGGARALEEGAAGAALGGGESAAAGALRTAAPVAAARAGGMVGLPRLAEAAGGLAERGIGGLLEPVAGLAGEGVAGRAAQWAARAAGSIGGSAVQGAIYGAGMGADEALLGPTPDAADKILADAKSTALWGAGLGALGPTVEGLFGAAKLPFEKYAGWVENRIASGGAGTTPELGKFLVDNGPKVAELSRAIPDFAKTMDGASDDAVRAIVSSADGLLEMKQEAPLLAKALVDSTIKTGPGRLGYFLEDVTTPAGDVLPRWKTLFGVAEDRAESATALSGELQTMLDSADRLSGSALDTSNTWLNIVIEQSQRRANKLLGDLGSLESDPFLMRSASPEQMSAFHDMQEALKQVAVENGTAESLKATERFMAADKAFLDASEQQLAGNAPGAAFAQNVANLNYTFRYNWGPQFVRRMSASPGIKAELTDINKAWDEFGFGTKGFQRAFTTQTGGKAAVSDELVNKWLGSLKTVTGARASAEMDSTIDAFQKLSTRTREILKKTAPDDMPAAVSDLEAQLLAENGTRLFGDVRANLANPTVRDRMVPSVRSWLERISTDPKQLAALESLDRLNEGGAAGAKAAASAGFNKQAVMDFETARALVRPGASIFRAAPGAPMSPALEALKDLALRYGPPAIRHGLEGMAGEVAHLAGLPVGPLGGPVIALLLSGLNHARASAAKALTAIPMLLRMEETVGRVDGVLRGAAGRIVEATDEPASVLKAGTLAYIGRHEAMTDEQSTALLERRRAELAGLSRDPAGTAQKFSASLGPSLPVVAPKIAATVAGRGALHARMLSDGLPLAPARAPLDEPADVDRATLDRFHRAWDVITDPLRVVRGAHAGTLTAADVALLESAHPELLQELRRNIVRKLAGRTSRAPLSETAKRTIGLVFDEPPPDGMAYQQAYQQASATQPAGGRPHPFHSSIPSRTMLPSGATPLGSAAGQR